METIKVRCTDSRCASPLYDRPIARGRLPLFCPTCTTRQEEEAAAWASQPLQLLCQDAECVSPSFSRLRGKGRKPNFCPVCMEKRKAGVVHRGPNKRKKTTKETIDQIVFSSTSPEEIERAMFALRHQYAREDFFINDDGDDKYIMMRQRTDISIAPIVLERIRVLAENALSSAIIEAMSEY